MRRIRGNTHYIKKNQRYINIHHKFIIIEFDNKLHLMQISVARIYFYQESGQCRTEISN